MCSSDLLGLNFRAVIADSGSIGGSTSHEFHVLADSGEDEIVFSSEGDYAANIEMAEGLLPPTTAAGTAPPAQLTMEIIDTGGAHSIDEVARQMQVETRDMIKTLIVHGADEDGNRSDERSEEHTSELQSQAYLVCRLLPEKKKTRKKKTYSYKLH